MLDEDACWAAVMKRERAPFFFGVMTTGIYCRPSCSARRPLRKNVRFYESPDAAEREGLRACLRCRPRAEDAVVDPMRARIEKLCRYIERHAQEPLTLTELAARVGLSPFHLQRSFKAIVGVTPKQFVDGARLGTFKRELKRSAGVTEAVYASGYGSSSRVYERSDSALGMTPRQYREGGRHVSITFVPVRTVLGLAMIGATDRGICFLQFGESEAELRAALEREYPNAKLEQMAEPGTPELREWVERLNAHLAGTEPRLDLPLDLRSTVFQLRVWNYLQSIPYGEVRSYTEVAEAIGAPKGARAVARACATNVVALVIPCHRVIRGSGDLAGYRWGLERKRTLIDKEREIAAKKRAGIIDVRARRGSPGSPRRSR